MDIKNKRIVITGGASGIGKSMALAFHLEGAESILISDINEEGAKKVAEEIKGIFLKTDVSDEDEINKLVLFAQEKMGGIDVFCSNVGIGGYEDFLKLSSKDWKRMLDINFMSHVYATRNVLPMMLKNKSGYFVFTASAAGLISQIGSATYSVTKHAVVSLAEWIKITYGKYGIGVSCSCPQFVRTPMTEGLQSAPGSDNIIEPGIVASDVLKAIEENKFLVTPHPEVLDYLKYKVSDYDRWISGMQDLQDKFLPKLNFIKK